MPRPSPAAADSSPDAGVITGAGAESDAAALAFVAAAGADAAHTETAAGSGPDDLAGVRSERARRLLDFEARWASHAGAKARAIREEFGWSTTRYYQVLDGLLATPEAVAYDPMLVARLLRVRNAQ